jgi:hypothetical protein
LKNRELVTIPRYHDHSAPICAPQQLHVSHLAFENQVACIHIDRPEMSLAVPAKKEPVTRIVSAEHRSHAVEIATRYKVSVPITVEVVRDHRIDWRKLGLYRKGCQCKSAVPVIDRDRACEVSASRTLAFFSSEPGKMSSTRLAPKLAYEGYFAASDGMARISSSRPATG